MGYATAFEQMADRFMRASSPRLLRDAKQDGGALVASVVLVGKLPELDFIRRECETLADEHDPPLHEFKAEFIFTTSLSVMSDRVNPLAVRWGGQSDGVRVGATDADSWQSQKECMIAFCREMAKRFQQPVAPVVVPADPMAVLPAGRKGRRTKAESKLLEANMLAHVREHQTLMDDPERLARLTAASASTARRFIESLRTKYAEMKRQE